MGTMMLYAEHVAAGGFICLFPEGQLHRGYGSSETQQLQPFRYGGFRPCKDFNMEIWGWATKGNNDCWPSQMPIGGFASHIQVRLFPIAKDGSQAFLDNIHEEKSGKDEDAIRRIATHAQVAVQKELDKLYNCKSCSSGSGSGTT